ncbi:MAG: hypothetical protein Q6373_009420 [Candidatus Sigynarchaeota archaeon]
MVRRCVRDKRRALSVARSASVPTSVVVFAWSTAWLDTIPFLLIWSWTTNVSASSITRPHVVHVKPRAAPINAAQPHSGQQDVVASVDMGDRLGRIGPRRACHGFICIVTRRGCRQKRGPAARAIPTRLKNRRSLRGFKYPRRHSAVYASSTGCTASRR